MSTILEIRDDRGGNRRLELAPGFFVAHGEPSVVHRWSEALLGALRGEIRGGRVALDLRLDNGTQLLYAVTETGVAVTDPVSEEEIPDALVSGSLADMTWLRAELPARLERLHLAVADIAAIDGPDTLAHHWRQLMATGRRGRTVEEALALLQEAEQAAIGGDDAGPLADLLARQRDAEAAHDEAIRTRAAWSAARGAATAAHWSARAAEDAALPVEAAWARRLAVAARQRASSAEALLAEIPDGREPQHPGGDAAAVTATEAVEAWARRPELPAPPRRPSATIAEELADLPDAPTGDLEPDVTVREAEEVAQRRRREAQAALADAPPPAGASPCPLSSRRLEELRAAMEADVVTADDPRDAVAAHRAAAERARQRLPRGLGLAAVVALVAVAVGVVVSAVLGLALAVVALVIVAVALLPMLRASNAATTLERRHAEGVREQARRSAARDAAIDQLQAAGLPATVEAVDAARDRLRAWQEAVDARAEWDARHAALAADAASADEGVLLAIRARGDAAEGHPAEAAAAYREACAQRAANARLSERRPALEAEHAAARAAEREIAAAAALRLEAQQALEAACGVVECGAGDDDDHRVELLRRWLGDRDARLAEYRRLCERWRVLQDYLGNDTVPGLLDAAQVAETKADRLTVDAGAARVDAIVFPDDAESCVAQYRDAASAARDAAVVADRAAEASSRDVTSLAGAEERLAEVCRDRLHFEADVAALRAAVTVLEGARADAYTAAATVLGPVLNAVLTDEGDGSEAQIDPATLSILVATPVPVPEPDLAAAPTSRRGRGAAVVPEVAPEPEFVVHPPSVVTCRAALIAGHGELSDLLTGSAGTPLVVTDGANGTAPVAVDATKAALPYAAARRQVMVFTGSAALLEWANHRRGDRDRATLVF